MSNSGRLFSPEYQQALTFKGPMAIALAVVYGLLNAGASGLVVYALFEILGASDTVSVGAGIFAGVLGAATVSVTVTKKPVD